MLRATAGPSTRACWAVAGAGRPVFASGIQAQSPTAHTWVRPTAAKVASVLMALRSMAAPAMLLTSGCGMLPAVHTRVSAAMLSPLLNNTRPGSAPATRTPHWQVTPRASSLDSAYAARLSLSSGRMRRLECTSMTVMSSWWMLG